MKNVMLILLCGCLAIIAACGDSASADTPRDLFEASNAAAVARDFDKSYGMLSKATQEKLEQLRAYTVRSAEAKLASVPEEERAGVGKIIDEQMKGAMGIGLADMKKMDGRAYCRALMEKDMKDKGDQYEKMTKAEFTSMKISGDKKTATIAFKDYLGKECTIKAVLEDGAWKIDMTDKFRITKLSPAG